MDGITQEVRNDVVTNRVNLLRATVNETVELRKLLDEQLIYGYTKIVVDLSQCTHLDSTFIGVLVVTQKKLLSTGGALKIVDPLDPAKELFYLTGISNIFDTFEGAEEAAKSFNSNPKQMEPILEEEPKKSNITWAFA